MSWVLLLSGYVYLSAYGTSLANRSADQLQRLLEKGHYIVFEFMELSKCLGFVAICQVQALKYQ